MNPRINPEEVRKMKVDDKMKKAISFILAVLMLASLGMTGYAEEESVITPELILERLAEGDEASQTAEEQAANGALRLAEMVVALDSLGAETQDEADHLNRILDMLNRMDVPEESFEHKLAAGTVKTFEALVIFQQQIDRDEAYADEAQKIFDSFLKNDEKAEGARQQAVNGLYHSVLVTSVIARSLCRNQDMIRQIDAEVKAFDDADKLGTSSDVDQLLLGSETLLRMLTAVASILDTRGSFSASVREISENTYSVDTEAEGPSYALANWLYGCVHMTSLIAEEMGA